MDFLPEFLLVGFHNKYWETAWIRQAGAVDRIFNSGGEQRLEIEGITIIDKGAEKFVNIGRHFYMYFVL
jgi:hypothetical protein